MLCALNSTNHSWWSVKFTGNSANHGYSTWPLAVHTRINAKRFISLNKWNWSLTSVSGNTLTLDACQVIYRWWQSPVHVSKYCSAHVFTAIPKYVFDRAWDDAPTAVPERRQTVKCPVYWYLDFNTFCNVILSFHYRLGIARLTDSLNLWPSTNATQVPF